MAIVIGITAKIGAGKTTVSKLFEKHGALVIDCDQIVHDFYKTAEGIETISSHFPESIIEGQINHQILGKHAFATPENKLKLESLTHPIVQREVNKFIRSAAKDTVIVVEIQLLFEKNADKNPAYMMDHVVVIVTPKDQRKVRALASRPRLTPERFEIVDAQQMDDEEKVRRAKGNKIDNSDGADAEKQVVEFLAKVKAPATPLR